MFKRTEEQIEFFKRIAKKGPFQIDFDFWYLCLLVGLSAGRKESGVSSVDMLSRFPERYSSAENIIISMVIFVELMAKGIDPSDRSSVKLIVDDLIDPSNRPFLSAVGFKACNDYSAGGFEIISDRFEQELPDDPAAFLIKYASLVKESFEKSSVW